MTTDERTPSPKSSPSKKAETVVTALATTLATTLATASRQVPPAPDIAVALIEDNRLVREGIAALLDRIDGLYVVYAESSDNISDIAELEPDVVLLDIGLRKGDSLRVATAVRESCPGSKVVIMDLLPVHEDIVEFVNAGVSGFILKDATLEDLVSTIRKVVMGVSVLPPTMVNTLFSQIARDAVQSGRAIVMESVKMTPRERQVINLIAEGMSNKEIASKLHIATHTVKSHVRNVMEKLALHTRLQIAAYAHGELRDETSGAAAD